MIADYKIDEITFDNDYMYLHLEGRTYQFNLNQVSVKLKSATEQQRRLYQVSSSGYGIHWPLIDEDLSVTSLLKLVS